MHLLVCAIGVPRLAEVSGIGVKTITPSAELLFVKLQLNWQ